MASISCLLQQLAPVTRPSIATGLAIATGLDIVCYRYYYLLGIGECAPHVFLCIFMCHDVGGVQRVCRTSSHTPATCTEVYIIHSNDPPSMTFHLRAHFDASWRISIGETLFNRLFCPVRNRILSMYDYYSSLVLSPVVHIRVGYAVSH